VKALASIALVLVTGLIAVSTADAKPRHPRLEKLALNAADMALAKSAVLQTSDLVSGWKGGAMTADGTMPPDCEWMDYSAYTITGRSDTRFTRGYSLISSSVQVFPDRAQALGDYAAGLRADTAACEGAAFVKAFGKGAKLVSAKSVAAPRIGDRSSAFRFTAKVGVNTFFGDMIVFVRGRSLGVLLTLNPAAPMSGSDVAAGLMDERLRPSTVA
jgi:hypothetical protein